MNRDLSQESRPRRGFADNAKASLRAKIGAGHPATNGNEKGTF